MRARFGFALALLMFPACSAPAPAIDDQATLESASVLHCNEGWFVVRPDLRRCAAPASGGYFVKADNVAQTTWLASNKRNECYVASLDWSATLFSSDEQQKLSTSPVVFHGRLIASTYAHRNYADLSVANVWAPAGTPTVDHGYLTVEQSLYRAWANGITCISAPCPSTTQLLLNTTRQRNIAGVDLSGTTANDKQIVEGTDALATGAGILVDGADGWTKGPAGSMRELVASNFYLEVTPAPRTCGGFVGGGCQDGEYCDVTIQNACGGADLPGVCKKVTDFCPEIYQPVCGCDGRTYGNDCQRIDAEVQLDHPGACN